MARINAFNEVCVVEAVSEFYESEVEFNTVGRETVISNEATDFNTNKTIAPFQGRRYLSHPTNKVFRSNYRREKPNYNNKTNTYNLGQLWLTEDYKFASFDEGFSGRLNNGGGGLSKMVGNKRKSAKSDLRVLTVLYKYVYECFVGIRYCEKGIAADNLLEPRTHSRNDH